MLLITGLPNRAGSLGYDFFTESKSGRLDQKLLVIRVAQTKYNDLFVKVTEPGPSKPATAADDRK